ncbi:2-dehydropantoate 2-reductase [Bacillus thermotolerans]|uniref:2-dehydropantoate 2-reductase n=1 Tax=Bacillus thermotolerans TaxID=1221996 RepID=A0A0F5I1V5_BACTR|nr:2-dehydropantoate 2-reductase [Bacillus thermotolerans]KKB39245.1 2-dehydropantoate 2-reductase [Bacillus thermotolerans]KKB42261.1 2-dehydropantoate 2-reductase [Bacillus thermotolerans]
MKVGVLGGGAIGLLFAAYLTRQYPVTLFTRTKEQAKRINEQGLVLQEGDKESIYSVDAKTKEELAYVSLDCLFVAVKQYEMKNILPLLNKINTETAIVFLQNGMGHLEEANRLPHSHLFAASVGHGAVRRGPAKVEIRGKGKTNIAVCRGDCQLLAHLVQRMEKEFPMHWKEDYESMLLRKLAVNTVINPLTAVLKITNGELIENSYYRRLAVSVYEEFMSVFREKAGEDLWEEVEAVCRTTASNHSSMRKDIELGHPTEVDAILGYMLLKAKEGNKAVPITTALYQMIKGLEQEE